MGEIKGEGSLLMDASLEAARGKSSAKVFFKVGMDL